MLKVNRYTRGVSTRICCTTPRCWTTDTSFCMDAQLMVDDKKSGLETWKKTWKLYINELKLGGGNSNIFDVHPELWGRWTQFDGCIFFRWVGSTTNQKKWQGKTRCFEGKTRRMDLFRMIFLCVCRLVSFFCWLFWATWIHHDLAEHGRIICERFSTHEAQKMSDSVGWRQKRCLHEALPAFVRWMGREARYPRGMMRDFKVFESFSVMDPQTVASLWVYSWLCPNTIGIKQGLLWVYLIYS